MPEGGAVASRLRTIHVGAGSHCVGSSRLASRVRSAGAEGFETGSTSYSCREPWPRGLLSSGLVRALGGRRRHTDVDAAGVEARAIVPTAERPPQPPRVPGPSLGRGGRRAAGECD